MAADDVTNFIRVCYNAEVKGEGLKRNPFLKNNGLAFKESKAGTSNSMPRE